MRCYDHPDLMLDALPLSWTPAPPARRLYRPPHRTSIPRLIVTDVLWLLACLWLLLSLGAAWRR